MAILTKYSKTIDTQSTQYKTQKAYIDSLATTENAPVPDDIRTPFSYQQWLLRNSGIIPGREYDQYNQYLTSWHQNTYSVSDTVKQVQDDYYALLTELSVAFSTPEEAAWFATLDITNDIDLEEAIPIFTKKLKEIAIYFVNKRDAIKKAKLKYNMVGSRNALKRLFYEYLLKAFTQRDYVLNIPEQTTYNTFPELSAVRDGFQIFVEDLYDDTSYFDKDPSVPVSAYYDLTNTEVLAYYETLNFETSALPWLFSTGISEVHSDDPLLWTLSSELVTHGVSSAELLPLSAYSEFDSALLNKYVQIIGTQKYLGEQQYIISGGYYELDSKDLNHNLTEGNNWFYWPSGEYFRENSNEITFDPILLTDTTLVDDGAVAGLDYTSADKVFTQVGQTISGAWLRYSEKYTEDEAMQATLFAETNTRFKFPFPGYGLSGEEVDWTGPQLINGLPMDKYPEEVLKIYWDTTPLSAIEPISIHDTTLIDSKALAAQEYGDADKIAIRITDNEDSIHDDEPNETYKDSFDRAWLYKMLKTDIPITVGQTYINWPIYTYDNDDATLALLVPSSQCVGVELSSINTNDTIVGARAGYGLFDSDLIYKLDTFNGYPQEAAWLSGADIASLASPTSTLMYNATGKIQPSLTLQCRPGNIERFVWQDSDTYIKDTTIGHHEHQTDCPYYLGTHRSILNAKGTSIVELGTNGIGDWNDCSCRAIKYSPLGHPGNEYTEYSFMADIVFVDTQFPSNFDLNTWVGTDLSSYNASEDFAFFQLTGVNTLEPDVGWGAGKWKTGSGDDFQFKQGVVYNYLRSNLKRNPGELIVDAVPDLIIKQAHVNTPKTNWMKAKLNDTGTWDKTTDISPMILQPSDYLMYDHIDSNWYCLSTAGDLGSTTSQLASTINNNTKWSTYDYVTTGTYVDYLWPSIIYSGGPENVAAELTSVTWDLMSPSLVASVVSGISPSNKFTYIAEETGVYSVTATGIGNFGTEVITTVPDLTSALQTINTVIIGGLGIETTYNDRINMTINIPLTGWDYATSTVNSLSAGARPFWAKAYDDSRDQTKEKATMKWGGGIRNPIDDYTYVTQPDISTLALSSNNYIDYSAKGSSSLTWTEDIEFIVNESTSRWSKLIIDNSKVSPLTDYLYNIQNEMVVSASEEASDIAFTNADNMFVNYWSNSAFSWDQQIVDSTNGLPPSGGRWVPPVSGLIVDPLVPYANLTNRHFPTIATAPYVGNLYDIEDSGGYFVPKMLGASVFLGRDWSNSIDASVITNDVNARKADATFTDPTKYTGLDRGLTQKDQVSPIVNVGSDQRWQKGGITEGYNAGNIVGAREHQEFIPYQTKYESNLFNFNGLRTQNDEYDPWTGNSDNIWADPTHFPANFRDEQDISGWYNNNLPEDKFIYQWKTDIFGNNYALLKSDSLTGVYDKRQANGTMWMRNQSNIISPISAMFPTYDLYQDSVSSVNYVIKEFDVWYDTLMLQTSSHVIIEHISFDWDNNRIFTIADDINAIALSADSGGKYGGHWLFDEENKVTICQVLSDADNNTVYPVLYDYDISTVNNTLLFNLSGHSMVNALSTLELNYIEDPVFTYNQNTKTYNVSFVGESDNYIGKIITTMNINAINGLESVYSITPNPPYSASASDMVITVKSDNAGSSTDQFILPLRTGEPYNFTAHYDGTATDHSSDSDLTLTFPSGPDTYDIIIQGTFSGFHFNGIGDKAKLTKISQWGNSEVSPTSNDMDSAFLNCSNLVITAPDNSLSSANITNIDSAWGGCAALVTFPIIDASGVLNATGAWQGCTSLTAFPLIDTSNTTDMNATWQSCTSLVGFPLIDTSSVIDMFGTWFACGTLSTFPLIDTSSATDMNLTWSDCSTLTAFPLIDTSSVDDMDSAWKDCSSLASFPLIDTSSVVDMRATWSGCVGLNEFAFPTLNLTLLEKADNLFNGVKLETESYSSLLQSISSLNSNTDVTFDGGNSEYNATNGATARAELTSRVGPWIITDGGPA